jgi:hypothetical protein
MNKHRLLAITVLAMTLFLVSFASPLVFSEKPDALYEGTLETWYWFTPFEEGPYPMDDAKVVEGEWKIIDLGGSFRVEMEWTELNIHEEIDGTYDTFEVEMTPDIWEWIPEGNRTPFGIPHLLMSGTAHWVKTNSTGVYTFEMGAQVEFRLHDYTHQFWYSIFIGEGEEKDQMNIFGSLGV